MHALGANLHKRVLSGGGGSAPSSLATRWRPPLESWEWVGGSPDTAFEYCGVEWDGLTTSFCCVNVQ